MSIIRRKRYTKTNYLFFCFVCLFYVCSDPVYVLRNPEIVGLSLKNDSSFYISQKNLYVLCPYGVLTKVFLAH